EHDGPHIDTHHLLHHRNQYDQPRPFYAGKPSQGKDHAALVLAQDTDHRHDQQHQQRCQDHRYDKRHCFSLSGVSEGCNCRTRPWRPWTMACSPGRKDVSDCACQVSPPARTSPQCPCHDSTSTRWPGWVLPAATTRLRWARNAIKKIMNSTRALAAVAVATTGTDREKSAAGVSYRNSEPNANNARPATPSNPSVGVNASAAISAMPSTTRPSPA